MKPIITVLFALFIVPIAVSAACSFQPVSKDTSAFLAEIPSLNTQLVGCPMPLDGAGKALLGNNGAVQLTITRSNGDTASVLFTISGGAISGVSQGTGTHGFEIIMTECQLDSILSSSSRYGAFAYLFTNGKVAIVAKGFWNQLKMRVARMFFMGAMKKAAVAVETDCLKMDGAVCQHGGECKSGNCVGVGQGPPWTYQCSCDPTTFKTNCAVPPVPVTNSNGKRPAGELCEHGGQCSSGNCVGVGQGPPWTYRCSCETSRYSTTGC